MAEHLLTPNIMKKYEPRGEKLDIRIKRHRTHYIVEYFDGERIDQTTLPTGKHLYHTRHSDSDCTIPVTIAEEGNTIIVNFCGSIVSDQPIAVYGEEKLMYVSFI